MWKWLTNRFSHGPFDPQCLGRPWGDRPSLFDDVERSVDPTNGRLKGPHHELPDESVVSVNEIRFSAGSRDGITMYGFGGTDASQVAQVIARQLMLTVKGRDPRAFNVLHGYLVEHPALSYVDHLNPLLTPSMEAFGGDLAVLGRHLLRNAADREVVKFAINLVGVCGDTQDLPALMTIGSHDEFTLYAVVAAGNAGGDIRCIWEIAKRVDGWGRIQCVERLDKEIADAEIRAWLITEGFRNSVMTEYSAAICARRGNLSEALSAEAIPRETIDGAAEILAALARGNPGEGMGGYADSGVATERFLSIVEQHDSPSVHWLAATDDIEKFVLDQAAKDEGPGWTRDGCARCARAISRIRSREVWHSVVAKGLSSDDDFQFNVSAEAARLIGLDPWESRFGRLLNGGDQWYWLLETNDPQRLDRVLLHASSQIDLAAIATGYGEANGLGAGFEEHWKLSWILQTLRRWPGRGAAFIEAGFRSPVVRNRWSAARAALCWDPPSRQPFLDAVRTLYEVEQNADVKAEISRILAQEVDPPESAGTS